MVYKITLAVRHGELFDSPLARGITRHTSADACNRKG